MDNTTFFKILKMTIVSIIVFWFILPYTISANSSAMVILGIVVFITSTYYIGKTIFNIVVNYYTQVVNYYIHKKEMEEKDDK